MLCRRVGAPILLRYTIMSFFFFFFFLFFFFWKPHCLPLSIEKNYTMTLRDVILVWLTSVFHLSSVQRCGRTLRNPYTTIFFHQKRPLKSRNNLELLYKGQRKPNNDSCVVSNCSVTQNENHIVLLAHKLMT